MPDTQSRLSHHHTIFDGWRSMVIAICMVMLSYQETLWLRFITGIGSGAYTAVAVATLAGTSRPARAFNILLFSFVSIVSSKPT